REGTRLLDVRRALAADGHVQRARSAGRLQVVDHGYRARDLPERVIQRSSLEVLAELHVGGRAAAGAEEGRPICGERQRGRARARMAAHGDDTGTGDTQHEDRRSHTPFYHLSRTSSAGPSQSPTWIFRSWGAGLPAPVATSSRRRSRTT